MARLVLKTFYNLCGYLWRPRRARLMDKCVNMGSDCNGRGNTDTSSITFRFQLRKLSAVGWSVYHFYTRPTLTVQWQKMVHHSRTVCAVSKSLTVKQLTVNNALKKCNGQWLWNYEFAVFSQEVEKSLEMHFKFPYEENDPNDDPMLQFIF